MPFRLFFFPESYEDSLCQRELMPLIIVPKPILLPQEVLIKSSEYGIHIYSQDLQV